ncbi:MAG: MFS transporter [Myxococcales bacterium]
MIDRLAAGADGGPRAEPALAGAQRRLLFVLGVATFIVGLDGRVVAPLLPTIATEFRVSMAAAGYLVSGYLLPYGLFQLAYGPLADRFGKVRVSAYAMVAFSVGTALCGVFSSFAAVLAARAFTGAAAAALIPLTIAYIGEVVPYGRRQAALAMLMASSGAAQAFSTSAGGLVAVVVSWRNIFPLLGALSGGVTLWLLTQAKHELRGAESSGAARYRDALQSRLRPLLGLVLLEGALFMGCFPFLSGLLALRFGLGALWIGLVLGAGGASQVLAARVMPALLRRWTEAELVVVGAVAMGLAYLVSAMASNPGWVALGVALLGAGFSICHSTLQTRATEVFPAGRGTALSLFAFSLFLGGGAGSLGMGELLERCGYERSFALAGVSFLFFAGWAWREVRRPARAPALLTASGALPARSSR